MFTQLSINFDFFLNFFLHIIYNLILF